MAADSDVEALLWRISTADKRQLRMALGRRSCGELPFTDNRALGANDNQPGGDHQSAAARTRCGRFQWVAMMSGSGTVGRFNDLTM